MVHSGGKRELVFFIIVFIAVYLFTASAVPYLGIRMEFLSFGGRVAQSIVKPDVMMALVICSSILSQRRRTVVLGIIFGFIIDVTCAVPMFLPLIYCICGQYASKLSFTFSGKGVVNAVFVAVPLALVKSVASAFYLLGTWHNISFGDIILGAVLPEYIYNIAVTAVVYVLLSLLMKLFKIERSI